MHPKRRTIGIRVVDHPVVQALLEELGQPLMSCTLIMPGEDLPVTDAEDIPAALESQVDLIIDGGHCGVEPTTVIRLTEGVPVPDLVAGVHKAIAARIYGLVSRLKIEPDVAVTGGGAKNIGLVRALEARLGYPVLIPPEPLLTGAIGAALIGKDTVRKAAEDGLPLVRSRHPLQQATFFT